MTNKFLLGLSAILIAGACAKENYPSNGSNPPVNVQSVQALGAANASFGLDLFQEVVNRHPQENILISPWSVQTAFLMALNGANGNTAQQIQQSFYLGGQHPDTLNFLQKQLRILMEQQSGHPVLKSANAFFYDANRLQVLPAFSNTLTNHYAAHLAVENFSDPNTKSTINNWVKQQTNGKIEEIIQTISSEDLAFLINAIYFQSDWERGFPSEFVRNHNFTEFDGSSSSVPFVFDDNTFQYSTANGLKMVEVPFKGLAFSMQFIMPDQPTTQTQWVQQITPTQLQQLQNQASEQRLFFGFPKLQLKFNVGLIPDLYNLGVADAFEPGAANFSNLGTPLIGPNIYISSVEHSAVLKVDEKGAEGAAVTSLGFSTTSMPPSVVFDHPFVIIIKHNATQTQLFTGLVGTF